MSYADHLRRVGYHKLFNGKKWIPGTFVKEVFIRNPAMYNQVEPTIRWVAYEDLDGDQRAVAMAVSMTIDTMVMQGNVTWWNRNNKGRKI